MDKKNEIIKSIVNDENNHSLITIREKVKQIDSNLISKELFFGLKEFLKEFFNNHFSTNQSKNINFNKIEIHQHHGLFNDLFSNLASKKTDIEKFDIVSLCEKSNFIYTEQERYPGWDDNVYSSSKKDVMYAITKKEEVFECMDNCIQPRYKSSLNTFNFGTYTIHDVSTAYSNLPYMVGVSWFASELKDFKTNLHYSFEYNVDFIYLEMLYEIFKILSDVNEDLAKVVFTSHYTGKISVSFKKANEDSQSFVYNIEANNLEELYQILKNTEQNTFINFLSKNNLYFEYKDNYLTCSKLSNKKIFSIDNLYISNFSSNDMNYIMANINTNLNLIDLAYYSIRLLLPVQEDIEKEFKAALPEYKTKLFIAIFSIEKNVDYSNYALDDGDIAKIYGTTKNNIIETYKKRKVEQYEILRLGATCKAFGIKENDLLDIVKNYKLKRMDVE